MTQVEQITSVAVVGTGLIGASWAAWFLASGLDVVATDTAEDAESRLRATVAAYWPVLERIGLRPGAAPDRLRFVPDVAAAVEQVGFVQESGPERADVKAEIYRQMDEAAHPGVVIASSSSFMMPSVLQAWCPANPDRVVLGHPFNPPHLIPLVEVCGGVRTDPAAVDAAMAFYAAVGKRPIRLKREITGHVANRLQSALWREAMFLLMEGVADVADIDAAIAHGPGLRWALLGPFMNLHLSGGAGGMAYMMDHLGPSIGAMWQELGQPEMTPELAARSVTGVNDELASVDPVAMQRDRDELLVRLMALKAASALP
jgi:3-hydroxyacyl-CoA dehydrogenase